MTFAGSWFDHPLFIAANAAHVREALARLPEPVRAEARIVFTAHSIPTSDGRASRYREQLADRRGSWPRRPACATGRSCIRAAAAGPRDPWLEPDVCDYLRQARAEGLAAAVLCPIGFVCDHIEVLYDLDHEAAAMCAERSACP